MSEVIDRKYSVYVALGVCGIMAMTDLVSNGSVEASKEIVLALIGFAGVRQALKTFLNK
jgi:uncharacterized membrane protein YuzA (DUF378 family)